MNQEELFFIGVIVNNHFGVLTRVSSLFSRRGYNIESLVVGVTDHPEISRMTIAMRGDTQIKAQVLKQLRKLIDVVEAGEIPAEQAVIREHMLIKIRMSDNNAALSDIIGRFGGEVVDFCVGAITVEVTGAAEKNDEFVESVRPFGILEICRAGAQALHRGPEKLV